MFIGTLVKPKFAKFQDYFCRSSNVLVDVENIFSHALPNNRSFDNYESFCFFLDLSQGILLIVSVIKYLWTFL